MKQTTQSAPAPKPFTVQELIDQLLKMPKDAEVVFYEKGACFDAKVHGIRQRDKTDIERNQVTII